MPKLIPIVTTSHRFDLARFAPTFNPALMNTAQAHKFFNLWVDACAQRQEILLNDWRSPRIFSSRVFDGPSSLIKAVADGLGLQCYCGYYCLDAILFEEQDLVPNRPGGTTWVRRVRVAFEHENNFKSGLFQEVSHLMITDCDLRVLVSYPETVDDLKSELDHLHAIIRDSDRADRFAEGAGFLFVLGWPDFGSKKLDWLGYLYDHKDWRPINELSRAVLAPGGSHSSGI